MAGRGTDIILGGNTVFKVKQKLSDLLLKRNQVLKKEKSTFLEPEGSKNIDQQKQEQEQEQELEVFVSNTYKEYEDQKSLPQLEEEINNLPYSLETSLETLRVFYTYLYNKVYAVCEKENKIVKELGGLFVLGTERHETRRIDNQLRGRAGRQGDPGNSQFFISLEDELIKVFGGDSIRRWVDYLTTDKESPLESDLLTKSLEKAQQKVELYNYDLRKNVFQYDDILNTQRKQLFQARKQMLSKNIYQELFLRYAECSLDEEILTFKKNLKENFFSKVEKQFNSYSSYFAVKKRKTFLTLNSKTCNDFYSEIWISNDLRFAESNFYQLGFLKSTRATSLLSIIDFYWTEHLERMSYIRETINWRSYGQQTPLVEYNMEASKSFKLMLEQIRSCMIYYFLSNPIN